MKPWLALIIRILLAACWGLSMRGKNWEDNTRMVQVKRREFECVPSDFDFSCDRDTAICKFEESDTATVGGQNREADDQKAEDFLKANEKLTDREVSKACLDQLGIVRSYKWFQRRREKMERTE